MNVNQIELATEKAGVEIYEIRIHHGKVRLAVCGKDDMLVIFDEMGHAWTCPKEDTEDMPAFIIESMNRTPSLDLPGILDN